MPYMQLNDLSLNYYDNGRLHQPALVFIHGLGENLESWGYQLQYFDLNYRLIAMDLRGHGKTNDGFKEITIKQLTLDVLALLDYLGIHTAHFVGLSMGGMIGQELTKYHQDRMLSLSLCDTTAFTLEGNAKWLKMLHTIPMSVIASYVTKSCLAKTASKVLYDQVLRMFACNRHASYLAAAKATFAMDFRFVLPNIYIPTLVLVGSLDKVTPLSVAQYLYYHIPKAQLVVIPKAGHLTKLEQPKRFNQALDKFLTKL